MYAGSGKYRSRGAQGSAASAFVVDRSISFSIGEPLYRFRRYKPAFDDLPWEDDLRDSRRNAIRLENRRNPSH